MRLRRALIVVAVAAGLMTILGAFGTGSMPLGARTVYWLVVMATGALLGIGASAGVRAWGGLADVPVREGALISVLIAAPLTLTVGAMNVAFLGGKTPNVASVALLFAGVLAVTAAIITVNYMRGPPGSVAGPTTSQVPMEQATLVEDGIPNGAKALSHVPSAALMARLPAHLRGAELHAIQAEDHYLRVHTDAGDALILLRFSDAMGEIGEVDGVQTHRSWWVARAAIQSIRRLDGRAEITMHSGVTVPVSRAQVRPLLDRGWLA